jgi:hypothetical protein
MSRVEDMVKSGRDVALGVLRAGLSGQYDNLVSERAQSRLKRLVLLVLGFSFLRVEVLRRI